MNSSTTTEEFLKTFGADADGMYYKESVKEAMVEFAKLHVEAALKEASESRCLEMFGQTWYAQSLEPGTKVLDRVNITVNKEAILNAYPLDSIK